MTIENLNVFLQNYFTSHHCKIINNDNGVLTVQLTEAMDKALMNRPFYWHYINRIDMKGEPFTLTLITNPNKRDKNGEWVHFGSTRLHQIINHLKKNEVYTQLFQAIGTNSHTPLYPWLLTNIKVSYIGMQKKDELFSIGLNLINGQMNLEMMEKLKQYSFNRKISDFCYPLTSLIKLSDGFIRIKKIIEDYLKNQSHDWAIESLKKLEDEISLVEQFYDIDADESKLQREIEDIKNRYKPRISYKVVNGGIFYLAENVNLN